MEATDRSRSLTAAYIAPFLAFVCMMSIERSLSLPTQIYYPIRFTLVISLLLLVSRPVIQWPPSHWTSSVAVGILVFLIWIAPDLLFGYRDHWLFHNAITGEAVSSVPPEQRRNLAFVVLRVISCTIAVPLLEELFWRGWLLRWLAAKEFTKVPYTRYVPSAFWIVVLMFGSEHGPYWEVGLTAGIIYNWWIIRTGNLADTILAHAVTNGLLSWYVLATGQWQYWL